MQINDGKAFTAERRHQITRLAKLGVIGNRAAILGHCKVTEEERNTITEAILKQKRGATAKGFKIIKDAMKSHKEESPGEVINIVIKKAKLADRAVVRWQRKWAKEERVAGEDEVDAGSKVAYSSRMLECTGCGEHRETKAMQLRTITGYRAIHCLACKKQEVCTLNRCQCGTIWHLCKTHRTDPAVHRSRKAPKNKASVKAPRPKLDPRRKPPEILHVRSKRRKAPKRGEINKVAKTHTQSDRCKDMPAQCRPVKQG